MSKAVITATLSKSFVNLSPNYKNAAEATAKYLGRDWLRNQMRRLVSYVQEEAPKRTGEFAKSHNFKTFERGNEFIGKIYAAQPLAGWIVSGTGLYGPHKTPIVPVKAKALRFVIGSRVIFAKSVRGMKSNKYDGRAYRRWQPGIRADLKDIGQKFTREFTARAK